VGKFKNGVILIRFITSFYLL